MKVDIEVTVLEGYSDGLTGRLAESVSWTSDFAAAPARGDYIETGCGDQVVEVVFWRRDGSALLRLRPIYTLDDTAEAVIERLREGGPR